MICITVAPVSRKLAKADLLNAAREGDIVELCLDHLAKDPDVKDLISAVDKPIIVSCRRSRDGGHWKGTEQQRLMLLRQAITAEPDYIELDLDIAAQIARYGKTKRLISFTRMDGPETDIERVFEEAAAHDADVVKYTWPTRTIDDAWPLMAAVTQKRDLPIVGMGLGRPEITFSILGHKYGSPWIYAALERGMEAHDGQATAFDLNEIYDFRSINRQTLFVAIAGMGESATITTKVINAGFRETGQNIRCLPVEIGDLKRLEKIFHVLHVSGVLVFGHVGKEILPMAKHLNKLDFESQYVDMLLCREDGWHGYNTMWRSGLKMLEAALGKTKSGQRPLTGKNVLVLGSGGVTQTMVFGVMHRQGIVSVSGPSDDTSQQIASLTGCRSLPFHNVYDSLYDAIIIADPDVRCGQHHGTLNPSLLRASQTVMDVSNPPQEHELFTEARARGCRLVEPRDVFADQIAEQFCVLSGHELPTSVINESLS